MEALSVPVTEGEVAVDDARRVLQLLGQACCRRDVQHDLAKLQDRGGIVLQLGRSKLMQRALTNSAVGGWTVRALQEHVLAQKHDVALCDAAQEVETLLGFLPGTLFGIGEARNTARKSAPPPPTSVCALSLVQTSSLLEELERTCTAPEFQVDLKRLRARSSVAFHLGLAEKTRQTVDRTTKKQGLGDGWNMRHIQDAVYRYSNHLVILSRGRKLEATLCLDPGKLFCNSAE